MILVQVQSEDDHALLVQNGIDLMKMNDDRLGIQTFITLSMIMGESEYWRTITSENQERISLRQFNVAHIDDQGGQKTTNPCL